MAARVAEGLLANVQSMKTRLTRLPRTSSRLQSCTHHHQPTNQTPSFLLTPFQTYIHVLWYIFIGHNCVADKGAQMDNVEKDNSNQYSFVFAIKL